MKPATKKAESNVVSIGVPVQNGSAHLDDCLNRLLGQSHNEIELLLSDNASDVETASLCRDWERRDRRVRYFRHDDRISTTMNFYFVLQQATGPYFHWSTQDDWHDAEFVSANLNLIKSNPQVVCSMSHVEFLDKQGKVVPVDARTKPLMRSAEDNLIEFLRHPAANSRFFGLFRTEVIRESFRETDTYWAGDWVIMARTLMWGKHQEVKRCLLRRGVCSLRNNFAAALPDFQHNWLTRRFPMLPMTWTILSDASIPFSWSLCRVLWRWNVRYRRHILGLNVGREPHRPIAYPALQRIGLRRKAA